MNPRRAIVSLSLSALLFATSAAAVAAAERGRELVNSLGCLGCHQIGDSGGKIGPSLDGVGARLERNQIRQQLTDPRAQNPNTMMPSYAHIQEEDFNALLDYLSQL